MQIKKKIWKNEMITEKIICNKCGKEIRMIGGRLAEGVCSVQQNWEYGSDKDGDVHAFDLCEACYDELIRGFQIEPELFLC